ncbi:MAG: hypothetical protein R3B57_09095 [Phycisphaerales bacterium]
MNESDEQADRGFEALLRELGPDVPQPELEAGARERLMAVIAREEGAHGAARVGRGSGWKTAAGIGLVAALGVACTLLSVGLGRVENELAASRWETGEALTLLMKARQSQETIEAPEDLGGVRESDLTLITFDHRLCPIARVSTPAFRAMAEAHGGEAARFMVFDVTGDKREEVSREIDSMGMGYALGAPLGAETGVVKVLDTRRGRVLSSAAGARGLEQAEALLARVAALDERASP